MNNDFYVVVKSDDGKLKFVVIDVQSGGYPYITTMFKTHNENVAKRLYSELSNSPELRISNMSDGSKMLPSLIRAAGDICNKKTHAIVNCYLYNLNMNDSGQLFSRLIESCTIEMHEKHADTWLRKL